MHARYLVVWIPILALAAPAGAQPYEITSFTIDGGGGVSSGEPFVLSGTAGQPDAGVLAGPPWAILGGFWSGEVPAPPCPVDLNGDGLVDFSDYLEFLNLFEAGDFRVDFAHDGIIDFLDYLAFLNLFNEGC